MFGYAKHEEAGDRGGDEEAIEEEEDKDENAPLS